MKTGLNFHETFPPTLAYISRVLKISDGQKRELREISDITGIPQGESSGKVRPHLCYAMYMGLLEDDMATRTPLGELVLREDPACQEQLTQWLLHANLTGTDGADMWHYAARVLLADNHGMVNREFYDKQMDMKYGARTRHTVVESTYVRGGLSQINFLSEGGSGELCITHQKVKREMLYVYAYDIVREWSALYPDEHEITAEMFNAMRNPVCFGLSYEEFFSVIETMAGKELLRINRQLSPFTVMLSVDKKQLLDKLYSLLL